MAKITYKGPADVRALSAADLGVDGFEGASFLKNQSVEVDDAVAEKLLSRPKTYGRFIRTRETVDAEAESAEVAPPKPDSTSQLGVDSAAGETAATSRKKS